jgi:putative addiction module killer protein
MERLRYQRADGSEPFTEWLAALCDKTGVARIRMQLRQIEAGNFGDCEPVGERVIEMHTHFGPFYRAYCGRHGKAIVLLLCGGDKSTQARDIRRAKELWSEWKRRQT